MIKVLIHIFQSVMTGLWAKQDSTAGNFRYEEVHPVSPKLIHLVEKISHRKYKTLTPQKNRVRHSFPNCIDNLSQNCIVWPLGGSLCPLRVLYDFRGSNLFHPLFGLKSQIMTLGKMFWKSYFIGHCSFIQFFIVLKSLEENLKYLWRSYKDFGVYNVCAYYLRKSTISSQSCNFRKNFNIKEKK